MAGPADGRVEEAKRLATQLSGRSIQLDAVFITAGVAKFAPLSDVTEARQNESFNANVTGPHFQTQP